MTDPSHSSATPRERLLDAAEYLFAEGGFNGVSVRQIVNSARVNLGAIPYYFGTKENLFKEVLLRRATPMRDMRISLLKELYTHDDNPSLEEVIRVLLEPAFRTSRVNNSFRRLLGRASMDPTPEVRRMLSEVYTTDFMTVPEALRAKMKDYCDVEFFWKLNCFYGVMLFIQADTGKIQSIAGNDFDTAQPSIALKYVVPFLAAGMRATVGYLPEADQKEPAPKSDVAAGIGRGVI